MKIIGIILFYALFKLDCHSVNASPIEIHVIRVQPAFFKKIIKALVPPVDDSSESYDSDEYLNWLLSESDKKSNENEKDNFETALEGTQINNDGNNKLAFSNDNDNYEEKVYNLESDEKSTDSDSESASVSKEFDDFEKTQELVSVLNNLFGLRDEPVDERVNQDEKDDSQEYQVESDDLGDRNGEDLTAVMNQILTIAKALTDITQESENYLNDSENVEVVNIASQDSKNNYSDDIDGDDDDEEDDEVSNEDDNDVDDDDDDEDEDSSDDDDDDHDDGDDDDDDDDDGDKDDDSLDIIAKLFEHNLLNTDVIQNNDHEENKGRIIEFRLDSDENESDENDEDKISLTSDEKHLKVSKGTGYSGENYKALIDINGVGQKILMSPIEDLHSEEKAFIGGNENKKNIIDEDDAINDDMNDTSDLESDIDSNDSSDDADDDDDDDDDIDVSDTLNVLSKFFDYNVPNVNQNYKRSEIEDKSAEFILNSDATDSHEENASEISLTSDEKHLSLLKNTGNTGENYQVNIDINGLEQKISLSSVEKSNTGGKPENNEGENRVIFIGDTDEKGILQDEAHLSPIEVNDIKNNHDGVIDAIRQRDTVIGSFDNNVMRNEKDEEIEKANENESNTSTMDNLISSSNEENTAIDEKLPTKDYIPNIISGGLVTKLKSIIDFVQQQFNM